MISEYEKLIAIGSNEDCLKYYKKFFKYIKSVEIECTIESGSLSNEQKSLIRREFVNSIYDNNYTHSDQNNAIFEAIKYLSNQTFINNQLQEEY